MTPYSLETIESTYSVRYALEVPQGMFKRMDIKEGDLIKVINGPFERNMGVVEAVNAERQTLRAMISIFGRDTPVELEYNQVDKL